MENKNNSLVIVLLSLIIGLLIGYFAGVNQFDRNPMGNMMYRQEPMGVLHNSDMHSMMNMMQSRLEGKSGLEFEKAFINDMIIHHLGAVEMAELVLERSERPELIQMANEIITVQNQEIEMMRKWRSDWFD